jgi:hypothetical protein
MSQPNQLSLTTTGKKLRASVGATAVAVGLGLLHNAAAPAESDISPEDRIAYVTVHDGYQDASHIARHLIAPEDKDGNELPSTLSAEEKNERINKLVGLMMDGADNDGLIRPGDELPVDVALVDQAHLDELSFLNESK